MDAAYFPDGADRPLSEHSDEGWRPGDKVRMIREMSGVSARPSPLVVPGPTRVVPDEPGAVEVDGHAGGVVEDGGQHRVERPEGRGQEAEGVHADGERVWPASRPAPGRGTSGPARTEADGDSRTGASARPGGA